MYVHSCVCLLFCFFFSHMCVCVFVSVCVYEYACTSNDFYDCNICSRLFNAFVAWETETARWDHFIASLHNDTHTRTSRPTTALQHMVLQKLERNKLSTWRGERGERSRDEENRKKRRKKKGGIYWRSSFIWLISCFFPEALREKENLVSPSESIPSTITMP